MKRTEDMDSDSDDLYDPADADPVINEPKAERMDDVEEGEEEGEEFEEDSDDVRSE